MPLYSRSPCPPPFRSLRSISRVLARTLSSAVAATDVLPAYSDLGRSQAGSVEHGLRRRPAGSAERDGVVTARAVRMRRGDGLLLDPPFAVDAADREPSVR